MSDMFDTRLNISLVALCCSKMELRRGWLSQLPPIGGAGLALVPADRDPSLTLARSS